MRQLFETEMLKRKYINNILNKFNTINIFGFDMVWCSIIGVNVVLLLKYGFPSSNRYPLFAGWQMLSEQNKNKWAWNYLVLIKKGVVH